MSRHARGWGSNPGTGTDLTSHAHEKKTLHRRYLNWGETRESQGLCSPRLPVDLRWSNVAVGAGPRSAVSLLGSGASFINSTFNANYGIHFNKKNLTWRMCDLLTQLRN